MRSFIFDKFGYYEDDEYGIEFEYKGWHFQLELTDKSEETVINMKAFLHEINKYYSNIGGDIIASRDNKLIVDSNYGRVCLVTVKNSKMSLNDVMKFHQVFKSYAYNIHYKVSHLKNVWEIKTDHIEEKILPRIKYNDSTYDMLMENIAFASGLAENAIQYLEDSISFYGDELDNITLAHKRLNSLNSYTLFNPFNLVIDCPSRDLSELIKYDLISFDEFKACVLKYNLNKLGASLLLSRLLYPTMLYDMLEEYHLVKHDISSQIVRYYNKKAKFLNKIKSVHAFLVNTFEIKPIEWLN